MEYIGMDVHDRYCQVAILDDDTDNPEECRIRAERAELEKTTDTAAEMQKMAASTFSRYTNDRDYRAVVRTMFELLHTPQLVHQRAVERKRLQRLTRGVVATDATNLELTRSVVVSDDFVGDDEQSYEIDTDDGGIKLHLAARVVGEHKHPLGATVTEGETHESPQFEHLYGDVKVFPDLADLGLRPWIHTLRAILRLHSHRQ